MIIIFLRKLITEIKTLILGKGSTDGLDDTKLTAEAEYSTSFSGKQKKFSLSLLYNGNNSYLFVIVVKIYQLKGNNSELNSDQLCLGNISKDYRVDDMKKIGLYRYVHDFLLDYDIIIAEDILNTHK